MTIRSTANYIFDQQPFLNLIEEIHRLAPVIEPANTTAFDSINYRESDVSWIDSNDPATHPLFQTIWEHTAQANEEARWNFEIDYIEPLQYTVYAENQHYGWHVDLDMENSVERSRKISFTILLEDEHEGGLFELEAGSPIQEPRTHCVPLKKGDMLLFPSYIWHRVTPVTQGVRKSLVGWIAGPGFK